MNVSTMAPPEIDPEQVFSEAKFKGCDPFFDSVFMNTYEIMSPLKKQFDGHSEAVAMAAGMISNARIIRANLRGDLAKYMTALGNVYGAEALFITDSDIYGSKKRTQLFRYPVTAELEHWLYLRVSRSANYLEYQHKFIVNNFV